MNIGTIIQARTGSTRLPGKVLFRLPYDSDITVLSQVVRRVKRSKSSGKIIIATTKKREDDRIIEIAKQEGVDSFRGDEEDVLSRYWEAAKFFSLDIIVRVTSDCPCIDWQAIDRVVDAIIQGHADYVRIKGNHPLGTEDVEAFTFKALDIAYKNSNQNFEREHVTPYICYTAPQDFKIFWLKSFSTSDIKIRVVLDTIEDYALLCIIYDELYWKKNFFSTTDIISFLQQKPWLNLINSRILQKKIFSSLEEEIHEAIKLLKLQDLKRAALFLERNFFGRE